VVLAAAGWAVAVPLGWLMYQGLRALVLHNSDLSLPQQFPPAIPLGTLASILVLTLLVIRGSLHRAGSVVLMALRLDADPFPDGLGRGEDNVLVSRAGVHVEKVSGLAPRVVETWLSCSRCLPVRAEAPSRTNSAATKRRPARESSSAT
jgi:hypothetical protein